MRGEQQRADPPRIRRGSEQPPHIRRAAKPPTPTYQPLRLTARGAITGIVAVSLVSTLISVWSGAPIVSGLGFFVASVFAAFFTRVKDLLPMCVCPPVAYLGGALVALALTSAGSDESAHSALLSLMMLLAGAAPWLFFGTSAVLVIAVVRGLPRQISRFRADLRNDRS